MQGESSQRERSLIFFKKKEDKTARQDLFRFLSLSRSFVRSFVRSTRSPERRNSNAAFFLFRKKPAKIVSPSLL